MRWCGGPTAEVRAYLSLLDLPDDVSPSAESLTALVERHLERIPYDNLDIMMGRPPSTRPADVLRRIATVGRAGYCFHHNGVLGEALAQLGFEVQARSGHVWGSEDERGRGVLNHLAHVVAGVPTAGNPGGRWWIDAGLGEGPFGPMPLVDGPLADEPFHFVISALPGDGWSLRNDPTGTFTGVDLTTDAPRPDDVRSAHARLSTAPDGSFTRTLVVARRTARGCDVVRGCVATTREADGMHQSDLTTYDEWRDALGTLGLGLADLDDGELRALFAQSLSRHREWVEAGRP